MKTKQNETELYPVWFDYKNQAWIEGGVYIRCNHRHTVSCGCYGRAHFGERPTAEIITRYAPREVRP